MSDKTIEVCIPMIINTKELNSHKRSIQFRIEETNCDNEYTAAMGIMSILDCITDEIKE